MKPHLLPILLFIATLSTLGAHGATPTLRWEKQDHSLSLMSGDQVVWRFNHDPAHGKTFFDPMAPVGGPSITRARPADHVWHYGHWFSWKYLNGVNYWEEDPKTFRAQGLTRWSNVKPDARADHSARISMDLHYAPEGQPPVLSEKRIIEVSAPGPDGSCTLDWTMTFTAGHEPVKLDRTPLPGEPGGAGFGGYAGLSVRMQQLTNHSVITTRKNVEFKEGRFRENDIAMDYSGELDGKRLGVAILDHPQNRNHPTPWYAIRDRSMNYVNAALLCFGPITIDARESFTLKYRVIVHPGAWDADRLRRAAAEFARQ